MTRETRANLIFITIFLLISAPGLVMLVNKKMESGRAPLWLPVPARQSIVYIDPIDAPPTIPRLTPALTASWVADLVHARLGAASVPMRAAGEQASEPVMSAERLAQLVAADPCATGRRMALLIWNLPREAQNVAVDLRAAQGVEGLAVKDIAVESIDVPHAVKRDLQDSGIPAPPLKVWWMTATIASLDSSTPVALTIHCTVDGREITDTLTLGGR